MPVTRTESDTSGPEVIYHHEPGEDRERRTTDRTEPRVEKTTAAVISGGSSMEALGGAAAVVLAIIALAAYLPFYLTAIAAIVVGGALLAHGGAVAARWNQTVASVGSETDRVEVAGGLSSEVLGGAAVIALGILSLIGVLPMVLLPISAIVAGGAIVLGAPAQPEVARLARDPDRRTGKITYEATEATSGTMVLAGLAAVVLGILGLLKVGPALTLTAVAMLVVGGAQLLSGGVLAARFGRAFQHAH